MTDKNTTQDHIEDLMTELTRTRHVLRTMTDTAHRLHNEAETHKAEVEELRVKLAIAQAEVDGYVKRHDADRRIITELGERMRRLA